MPISNAQRPCWAERRKQRGIKLILKCIRLCNFQSFGPEITEISFENMTYLIGPNGAGKTAILQALCKLFSIDPALRRITKSDFHVPINEEIIPDVRELWVEADFHFPELNEEVENNTVPPHFGHMRLNDEDGVPRVRFRLSANFGLDDEIDSKLEYVLDTDTHGTPLTTHLVPRSERNYIQMHYLPARRDPSNQITYGTNAILGRLLRAVNWTDERNTIRDLANQISENLVSNESVESLNENLKTAWVNLHKGSFFSDPKITFVNSEMESLLRHLSLSFSPGHHDKLVDFTRLSDGHKSMLYLSLVLSSQAIGRTVLSGENEAFNVEKLRPPVFTLIAIEEPENSLSPQYLGRIVTALKKMSYNNDAQSIVATHAPSMLKRVEPEQIRFLRLSENRVSTVKSILLPPDTDEAYKFVREAVLAFPELYFSRLVVLGEGDSEEIVLPRILRLKEIPVDESAISIVPLGGRHVNHFWRLLSNLQIPYVTLLDLDVARYQGGWGRVKYVNDQLGKFQPAKKLPADFGIPNWNSDEHKIRSYKNYLDALEERDIFYSFPLDLDFAMLLAFPEEYSVQKSKPQSAMVQSVLGKSHHDSSQYSEKEQSYFDTYHQKFKLGSKPAAHIEALGQITDDKFLSNMPESYKRLADKVTEMLAELPE